MTEFIGSRTDANLRQAFTTAALAYQRYTDMAEQAAAEGRLNAAALFRHLARSQACQAEAHLSRLEAGHDKALAAANDH